MMGGAAVKESNNRSTFSTQLAKPELLREKGLDVPPPRFTSDKH